jgi:hypothetical protein
MEKSLGGPTGRAFKVGPLHTTFAFLDSFHSQRSLCSQGLRSDQASDRVFYGRLCSTSSQRMVHLLSREKVAFTRHVENAATSDVIARVSSPERLPGLAEILIRRSFCQPAGHAVRVQHIGSRPDFTSRRTILELGI